MADKESTGTPMEVSTTGGGGGAAKEEGEQTSADYYFDSYAHFGIHEEMLKDKVRTLTYRKAIEGNKHLFSGKTVLDVGCGTGILSMFAARAGAAHVYGIEMSTIGDQATQIVADNGLSDVVTIVRGKCEDITLPVDSVDIIISEWMGYALLYESMLPSVLYARDKWMAPGGKMLPDRTTVVISAIEDEEYKAEKIDWWESVYGFNMSHIKALATKEPLVDIVNPEQVVTNYDQILEINTETCTKDDLAFTVPFKLVCARDDYIHAFVLHFDTWFGSSHTDVMFTTGCHDTPTHWKQSVFYLHETLTVKEGEEITGSLTCNPNGKNPRDLDFVIEYEFNGELSQSKQKNAYRMR